MFKPRYWVVGGQYEDCDFSRVTPGTETMSGPFTDADHARGEWRRLSFRGGQSATTRYAIAIEPTGLTL